jgi:hypothetical protein
MEKDASKCREGLRWVLPPQAVSLLSKVGTVAFCGSVAGALNARPLLIRGKNIAVQAYLKWYESTVRRSMPQGPKMPWEQRAKASVDAKHFQAALAARFLNLSATLKPLGRKNG